MDRCIYYPKQDGLTYEGEDHIVSAAIGGKAMLPKGYVSDKFNGEISKIELDLFRNGLPGFARVLDGPGKRGSLKTNEQKKSTIKLMSGGRNGLALGYVKIGKAYEIPQVLLRMDNRQFSLSFDANETQQTPEQVFEEFRKACLNYPSLKCKVIEDSRLGTGEVLFGIRKSVEDNFNCFLAKHTNNTFRFNEENVGQIAALLEGDLTPAADQYFPKVHFQIKFSEDHLRVFGKMAFNLLAKIKGHEFVLNPAFDPLREWVTKGGNYRASLDDRVQNYVHSTGLKIPTQAHVLILISDRQHLYASVSLYNSMPVILVLAENFNQQFCMEGMICDWRAKKEFSIHELIRRTVAVYETGPKEDL